MNWRIKENKIEETKGMRDVRGRKRAALSQQQDDTTAKLRAELAHTVAPVPSAQTAKLLCSRKRQVQSRILVVCVLAPLVLWLELTVNIYGILWLGIAVGVVAVLFFVAAAVNGLLGRTRRAHKPERH